jgi:hypothetical protein
MDTIIGYISAPTSAGRHYAADPSGYGFRGRAPRWHATLAAAKAGCRYIECRGRRDGGRGRDCYIVSIVRTPAGIEIRAGDGGGTGLWLGSGAAKLGCSGHVEDARVWIASRTRRWLRAHGLA